MTTDPQTPLPPSLGGVIDRLAERAHQDPDLRDLLRTLGEALIQLTEEPAAPSATEPDPPAKSETLVPSTLAIDGEEIEIEVQKGGVPLLPAPAPAMAPAPRTPAPTASPRPPVRVPADLATIAKRCRVKARASAWAVERRRRLADGADFDSDIEPTDNALGSEASALPDCYTWMLTPYGPHPTDAELATIEQCYESMALAADAARKFIQERGSDDDPQQEEPDADLAQIIASIQSALRKALLDTVGLVDHDQVDLFSWLRDLADDDRIYIAHHMRLTDVADPESWEKYRSHLASWIDSREARDANERRRKALLSRIRYHANRIIDAHDASDPDVETLDQSSHDWTTIFTVIQEWVEQHFPFTHRALCTELARLEDIEVPDDIEIPGAAERVLEAVDEHIALRQRSTQQPLARQRQMTENVHRAANLLRGRTMVLIGGDERPHARAALEHDLELGELRWIRTKSGLPLDRIRAEMTRGDVAVVVLAIRWTSHVYGSLGDTCREHNIPFVRLRAGYHPNQVAHHVLKQAGRDLERDEQ